MITPTQNRIARQSVAEPAQRGAGTRTPQADFRSLFSQSATRPASPGGTAAAPAPAATPESLPASTAPQTTGAANPFSPQAVEDHMNNWLMGVLRHQNEVQMQLYRNAMDGWNNTNARNRQLGLPEIPPPPAPELAEIAPMPAGWWFETHS